MSIATASVQIPPSGDGALGALTSVSNLVGKKTVQLSGTFQGRYDLLGGQVGSTLVTIASFQAGGEFEQTISGAFDVVQIRSFARQIGPVTCEISAVEGIGQNHFATVASLLGGFVGDTLPIDLWSLFPPTGIEEDVCFLCRGSLLGSVVVLGSLDGLRFDPVGSFQAGGPSSKVPTILEFEPLETLDKIRYLKCRVTMGTTGPLDVTVGGRVPVYSSGSVGATGATGATGAGTPGVDGATGATGAGSPGAVGATGATGAGTPGVDGATGATGAGSPGAVGATGATGAGTPGVDGATGATGVGSPGSVGATGATGAGTPGVDGATGATGVGSPGSVGATGATGAGTPGVDGATGATGVGSPGSVGATGATGAGTPGAVGATGATGTGSPGTVGATGATGSAAPLVLTALGDLVTFDGANLARLPVGTDGQLLTSRSTAPLGIDWETPASPIPPTTPSFLTGRVVYATRSATTSGRSRDGGFTWVAGGTLANGGWYGCCWDPDHQRFVTISNGATNPGGSSYSIDGGASWLSGGQLSATIQTWFKVFHDPVFSTLFAVPQNQTSGAVYSLDGGNTWNLSASTIVSTSWFDAAFDPTHNRFVMVANGGTASMYTTDGGVTWQPGGATPNAMESIAWDPVHRHMVTLPNTGVTTAFSAYSTDAGLSWITSAAVATGDYYGLCWDPVHSKLVGVDANHTTTIYSIDGGLTWANGGALGGTTALRQLAWNQADGVLIACNIGATNVIYSESGGLTWSSATTPSAAGAVAAVAYP